MKNKFNLNDIYIKRLSEEGIDLSDLSKDKNYTVKRISLESSVESIPEEVGYVIGKVSTIDIDSDGDVVLSEGIDFKRYEKNPIILFNHSLNHPIGYTEKISVSSSGVVSKIKFSSEEDSQKYYQLVKDKVLRCFSIGFIPLEVLMKGTSAFNEQVKVLMKNFPDKFNAKTVANIDRIVTKSLLIETSLVSVPSNEDALVEIVKTIKVEDKIESKEIAPIEPIVDHKPIEIKRLGKEISIKRCGTIEDEKNKLLYKSMWGV